MILADVQYIALDCLDTTLNEICMTASIGEGNMIIYAIRCSHSRLGYAYVHVFSFSEMYHTRRSSLPLFSQPGQHVSFPL